MVSDGDDASSSVAKASVPLVAEDEAIKEKIDFKAEGVKITELLAAHATAHADRDMDEAVKYWLKLEKPEVFIVQKIGGALNIIEKWSGIKRSFEDTLKKIGRNPIPGPPGTIGINSRGKNATAQGKMTQNWAGASNYLAALQKNKSGAWKIKAVDFYSGEDHKLIRSYFKTKYNLNLRI